MPPLVTIGRTAFVGIHNYLALGLIGAWVRNDDGSWMEWESTPALTVEK